MEEEKIGGEKEYTVERVERLYCTLKKVLEFRAMLWLKLRRVARALLYCT